MTGVDLGLLAALDDHQRAEVLGLMSQAERDLIEVELLRAISDRDPLPDLPAHEWATTVAPHVVTDQPAPEHLAFWAWLDAITQTRPDPYLELWPRGYAKSALAELGVIYLGARGLRNYCLYVSHTQGQADDHVGNIGAILESGRFAELYPAMAAVKVGKHGESKGWRRNRLRTASGFTVDALGLDATRRGARLEEQRPDMMVLDDIDDTHASQAVIRKNIRTITQALIPALLPNKVVMLAQNVVAPNSIAAQLGDGRLDMLGGAVRSGPFPLVEDMQAERVEGRWRITAGRPRWPGRWDLQAATDQLLDMGMDAFLLECQQDYSERPGAIWSRADIEAGRVDADRVPELDRVVVGVDPNKTGRADDAGVVKVGRAWVNGEFHAYVLADDSKLSRPSEWRDSAAKSALRSPPAATMVVEYAGLGEHAELTVKSSPIWDGFPISVTDAKANLGKRDRARPVWRLYADGRVHHVGVHPYLEAQLTTWVPDEDPISPGALDALVHAVTHLLIDRRGAPHVRTGR